MVGASVNSASLAARSSSPRLVHRHEAELLQVRVGEAPAAALIEPHAVREHLAKGRFGLLEVEASEGRFEEPLGPDLGVWPVEAEGLLLGAPQLVAAQARFTGRFERAKKAGANEAHEQEVVEVTRL